MFETAELIAFVASSDLARSRVFYGTTLGLQLVEQSPFALVFDVHGTMLRVTAVGEVARTGYTVLGWRVTDLRQEMSLLTDRGVTFLHFEGMVQDDAGVWTTPGADLVAWFADPDGNTLSLTQFG